MPTTLELALGAVSVVVGVAWVIWPTKMMRWQARILYLGVADESDLADQNTMLGRVTGAVLAVLGLAMVLGLLP